ncbi:MAG: hypothetical protein M3R49_07880 [Chloroflexota bacterium]|nr:hypothetical protein [Chloroflexota bacterium]
MPVKRPIAVYLEVTPKRTFAAGVDWPGWCRSGRTEGEALEALLAYGPRYAKVVGRSAGFTAPADASTLEVTERLKGSPTTEFGAPGAAPRGDQRPLNESELKRQLTLLRAAWGAFDAALQRHASVELRKGPRGGGRDQAHMASHVFGAEQAYLTRLGARPPEATGKHADADADALRKAVVGALSARVREEPVDNPSGTKKLWLPLYFVRRTAWHALDHAWEIEDRATG